MFGLVFFLVVFHVGFRDFFPFGIGFSVLDFFLVLQELVLQLFFYLGFSNFFRFGLMGGRGIGSSLLGFF